ncbi:3413_t:CDS:2 [Funneliformis caledonium]|uniref:3413_t:CDS:1 n=1 Tax=Funneliformis caledonium TaxID=1117310 RepID=A0A9N9N4R7_9GLOM|nr:3413_t:CDS:2 [Funneliformis caledonium]
MARYGTAVNQNDCPTVKINLTQCDLTSRESKVKNRISDLSEILPTLIPNGFFTNNNTEWNNTEWREPDEENKENEDKFAEHYNAAKSKFIPRLCSFLYDLNRDLDPIARVKSGSMIRVQVESIKRRKSETSGGGKRKLPATISKGKEILEPQVK